MAYKETKVRTTAASVTVIEDDDGDVDIWISDVSSGQRVRVFGAGDDPDTCAVFDEASDTAHEAT